MTWLLSLVSGLFSSSTAWIILAAVLAVGGYATWTQLALSHRAQRIETLEARLSTAEAQRDQAKAVADENAKAVERMASEMRQGFAAVERTQAAAARRIAETQTRIIQEARRATDAHSPIPDAWLPTLTRRVPGGRIQPARGRSAGEGADTARTVDLPGRARPARGTP